MIRLRPVTPADVPELAELTRRCDATQRDWAGPDTPVPSLADQLAGWHERLVRPNAWAVLAEDEAQRVVGACAFASARERHLVGPLVPGLAHVSAVFVDPDHWRRGIARLLLEAADAAMLERGYTRAQLMTLEGSPAERLYAALGWTRTEERDHFALMDLQVVKYVKALSRPA